MSDYKRAGNLMLNVAGFKIVAYFIVTEFMFEIRDITMISALNALFISICAIYIPTLLFMKKGNKTYGRERIRFSTIFWSVILGIGAFQLAAGINTGINMIFEGALEYKMPRFFPPMDGWHSLSAIALICVIPAITEEQLFRGALLNAWRPMGKTKVVLLTAAMFSLLQLQPLFLPASMILAIILGLISYNTHSVYPGMIIHGTYNFASLLVSELTKKSRYTTAVAPTINEMLYAIVILVLLGSILVLISYLRLRKGFVARPIDAPIQGSGLCVSVGVTLAYLIFLNASLIVTMFGWVSFI